MFWNLTRKYDFPILSNIKWRIEDVANKCYYKVFTKPFQIHIWVEEYDEEEEEEEDKDELQINTFKSLKSAECVICLDNSPNILFCNCGHICICNVCLMMRVKEFGACPICKTRNPIKRMLE